MTSYRDVTITPAGHLTGESNNDLPTSTWVRFSAALDLLWIREALDVEGPHSAVIWDRQDGYGEPGHNAGDWSGIRDSSDAAIADMLTMAKAALPAGKFFAKLGLPVPRHLWPESGAGAYHLVLVHEPGARPEFFALSRRAVDDDTGQRGGEFELMEQEHAEELADIYNADDSPLHGGTAHVVEVFRYENDPYWPEESM